MSGLSERSPGARLPALSWATPWLLGACVLLGCIKDTRVQRDRGGGLFGNAPEVGAPTRDRCASLGQSGVRPQCEEARALARIYVRRLSVTDDICLEGGFGEVPGAACLARAFVADTGPGQILVELREARPESRWFNHIQHQVWFAEEALVDLYLAERGY